jgi:peptidoglycan hydrolase CwlO-like protein
VLAFAQPGSVQADTKAELNAAENRLDALQKEFDAIRDRYAAVHAELLSVTAQVSQATAQIEALDAAIQAAKKEVRVSEREAAELQTSLDDRARDVYIRGPAGPLELILEADSLLDLSDRASFLEVLSEADANVATGLQVERQQIAQLRKQLVSYKDDIQGLLKQLEGKQEEVLAKQQELTAVKDELAAKVAEAEEIVAKLEKKLQRELLAQYSFAGNPAAPPPSADGPFYYCPVGTPRSYIDDFGYPRVGHTHQGNDIFAPTGTPIHAPFAGRAEEGYDGLGGVVVHVYASKNADYVYNAHLVKHAGVDGAQVKPGDVIGYVGNTGNAAGTPPHDHFEYHPGGGSAVSPYVYLNEVCGVGGSGNFD